MGRLPDFIASALLGAQPGPELLVELVRVPPHRELLELRFALFVCELMPPDKFGILWV